MGRRNASIGLILLKNSRLIEGCRTDSILTMGGRIGDDGTEAGSTTGAVLRVLAGGSSPARLPAALLRPPDDSRLLSALFYIG